MGNKKGISERSIHPLMPFTGSVYHLFVYMNPLTVVGLVGVRLAGIDLYILQEDIFRLLALKTTTRSDGDILEVKMVYLFFWQSRKKECFAGTIAGDVLTKEIGEFGHLVCLCWHRRILVLTRFKV